MSFLLSLLLFLILVAVVAFTFNEGTWTNAIRLINVVTAGLVAFNFFEPVARLLEEYIDNGLTYVWDFVALWVLFSASMIIFRVATGQLSRVKVRFMMVVDRTGSVILALVVGWVMVCFISATLHTAPLAQKFLFGGFDYQQPLFLGMHPDNMWLGFVQYVSKGAYSRATSDGGDSGVAVFDAHGYFPGIYAQRRAAFESVAMQGLRTNAAPRR